MDMIRGELVGVSETTPRVSAWDRPLVDPNIEDARIAHTPRTARAACRSSAVSRRLSPAVPAEVVAVHDRGHRRPVHRVRRRDGRLREQRLCLRGRAAERQVHKKFAITPLMVGTAARAVEHGGHASVLDAADSSVAIDNHGRPRVHRARRREDRGGREARRGAGVRERHRATSTSDLRAAAGQSLELHAQVRRVRGDRPRDDRRPAHRLRAAGARSARWTSRRCTRCATRCGGGSPCAGARSAARDRHQPRRSDARRADQRERRVDRWQARAARRASTIEPDALRAPTAVALRCATSPTSSRNSIYRSCDIVLRHVVGAFSGRVRRGRQVRTSSTTSSGSTRTTTPGGDQP